MVTIINRITKDFKQL